MSYFSDQTMDTILKRMLSKVKAGRDKREGSIIYDASAPAAIEFELMYYTLDWFINQSFGDTANREFLVKLALERGIAPHDATYALVKGEFTPITLEVPLGSRFSLEEMNYIVRAKISAGKYVLEAETAGTAGNRTSGALIPINYIQGLETAQLVEVITPGENEEETEAFRERYLKTFDNQAYGGNIADYRDKLKLINGVGGVKVYPVHQGGGTVRVVFMTTESKPPVKEFVDKVQETIDPIPFAQQGVGVAPIGHWTTLEGATTKQIDIDLNLTLADGYSFQDIKPQIEKIIEEYFSELNSTWESTQIVTTEQYSNGGLIVRVSQIETKILEIETILDVEDTKINGKIGNCQLGYDELAVKGNING